MGQAPARQGPAARTQPQRHLPRGR